MTLRQDMKMDDPVVVNISVDFLYSAPQKLGLLYDEAYFYVHFYFNVYLKINSPTMSTITSPRPSISASSRRTSTSTEPVDRGSLRRNRAALRDYYNLNAPVEELDKPGFDAEVYVRGLLAKEGVDGILKAESGLVSEIRSLDGEKKALVYDNYSSLLASTDTIRAMRVDTPVTSTLAPAIAHIAEEAGRLKGKKGGNMDGRDDGARLKQRETVRWVLGAAKRLEWLVKQGRREEAKEEWQEVEGLLRRWEGVKGVEEVKRECEGVMGEG